MILKYLESSWFLYKVPSDYSQEGLMVLLAKVIVQACNTAVTGMYCTQ